MLRKSEMAEQLGIAAAVDQRNVSDADVEAWHLVLTSALGDGLTAADVHKAIVAHYGRSERRLMPSHVVEFVQKLRRVRKEQILPAYPPELADERGHPAAPNTFEPLMQWRAEALRLIANGQYQPDPPMPELLKAISQLSDEPQEPHSAARLWPAPPGWTFPAIPVPEIPPMLDPLASVPAELFDRQQSVAREYARGLTAADYERRLGGDPSKLLVEDIEARHEDHHG